MSVPSESQKLKKPGSTKGTLRGADERSTRMVRVVKATLTLCSSLPFKKSVPGITWKGI